MAKINDLDIYSEWGLLLKKGAYSQLFSIPPAKEHLTENVREEQGERVDLSLPRYDGRDVRIPFYMEYFNEENFWWKWDSFISYLTENGLIAFTLEQYNRTYSLYYKSCSDLTYKQPILTANGQRFIEFEITFREPNPYNVTEESYLITEDSQSLYTEYGENIIVNNRI